MLLSALNNRKGPNTVFLKPKKSDNDNSKPAETNKGKDTNTLSNKETSSDTVHYNPTLAFEDEGVMQSDMKSMKQSAISMSVGQQSGATQIVKDWLDDGGSADQPSTNNEQNSNEDEEDK